MLNIEYLFSLTADAPYVKLTVCADDHDRSVREENIPSFCISREGRRTVNAIIELPPFPGKSIRKNLVSRTMDCISRVACSRAGSQEAKAQRMTAYSAIKSIVSAARHVISWVFPVNLGIQGCIVPSETYRSPA